MGEIELKMLNLPISTNPFLTREDLQLALAQLLNPLNPYYSEGKARLKLGSTSASYPDATAEMEGFSRVLWGLVPLLMGGGDSDLWVSTYLPGIRNGTDPTHEEYWGEIKDCDQRIVEMAAFGYALAFIPEKIWDLLNEQEKANLFSWLNQINSRSCYDCNWLFFSVLVNLGLKKVGQPYDQMGMNEHLDRIDSFYISDGWYADGVNAHVDYYVPFAFHYYGLLYAKLMENEDPERCQRIKERAGIFAQDFIYWFSDDGSSLPYGRSLSYRFSQCAFWSAMVFAGVEPFPLGVTKGIILRHLRWWFQQQIFNMDGTLTIGYTYPNLVMAENYNSPGSPYWALKAFLPLAFEATHPFWQVDELPLPSLQSHKVQLPPHMIICRQEETGHVLAFNSGHSFTTEHTHISAKYEKFVYSSFFGFSVPRGEWGLVQGAHDSMLALSEGDNLYRVKRQCEESVIEGDTIYTKWKPWSDVTVQTWLITGTPWHVRVHCIESARYLDSAEGGFALGIENEFIQDKKPEVIQIENEVLVKYPWGASGITSLHGNGVVELIYPNANTNLIHSRTVIPTVKSKIQPGKSWLVSAVFGEPGYEACAEQWDSKPYMEISEDRIKVYSKATQQLIFQKKLN
jgi:hypothetical protein